VFGYEHLAYLVLACLTIAVAYAVLRAPSAPGDRLLRVWAWLLVGVGMSYACLAGVFVSLVSIPAHVVLGIFFWQAARRSGVPPLS
jgi:hypothetical protein